MEIRAGKEGKSVGFMGVLLQGKEWRFVGVYEVSVMGERGEIIGILQGNTCSAIGGNLCDYWRCCYFGGLLGGICGALAGWRLLGGIRRGYWSDEKYVRGCRGKEMKRVSDCSVELKES